MAQAILYDTLDEFCPSCGKWDKTMCIDIGWCIDCVTKYKPELTVCKVCMNSYTGTSTTNLGTCHRCARVKWQEKHDEEIQVHIEAGMSRRRAILAVKKDIRPRCIKCGGTIGSGSRSWSILCKKNPECEKWNDRWWYLRRKKKMSIEQATQEVMGEMGASNPPATQLALVKESNVTSNNGSEEV